MKSKHILIKNLIFKERIQDGEVSTKHIGTNSTIADPLTKGIINHTNNLGVPH